MLMKPHSKLQARGPTEQPPHQYTAQQIATHARDKRNGKCWGRKACQHKKDESGTVRIRSLEPLKSGVEPLGRGPEPIEKGRNR